MVWGIELHGLGLVKEKHMAEVKIKKITDERVLKAVRDIRGKTPVEKFVWTPDHQTRLVWLLMRRNEHFQDKAGETPDQRNERLKKGYAQWEADWNNGRLAYPSNTARSLAESGECRKPDEFSPATEGPLS